MAAGLHRGTAGAAMAAACAAAIWVASGMPAGAQGGQPQPLMVDDHAGFEAIFDGTSMAGWDGDPSFWRVEDGALVGESTPDNPVMQNTFLIWRGGAPADFELKVEFRINSTNSGIQYRSRVLEDVGPWVMSGYQADIDFANRWTGQVYEERGRGFLALRGQTTRITADGATVIGALEDGDALVGDINVNGWNQFHLIARGNTLVHVVNGHTMSVAIDEDTAGRALSGLIGFQMHVGDPMKVEFRNIYLKEF